MSNDAKYVYESYRLEGERDYWRNMHAKVASECAVLRNSLEERGHLQADKQEMQEKIERLELVNNALNTEAGHLQADKQELVEENERLTEQYAKLCVYGGTLAVIWIGKKSRGKSLPIVLCSFCPICGKHIDT